MPAETNESAANHSEDKQEGSAQVWPPSKEDLQRLYVEEHLSAMKIAKRYGLHYANPKTGESTVLHWLKKYGVERRDAAEHNRKTSKEIIDDWAIRYAAGESLSAIAGDDVSPTLVYQHLKKRGIELRDKVEAQIEAVTKFKKRPFAGTELDRAYLLGFARGDLYAVAHGRSIRIRTSSTHPAMIDLVTYLFAEYGPIRVYPHHTKLVGYEWSVECDLHSSFRFLLSEKVVSPSSPNREISLSYLAGLFDAEGSIVLRSSGKAAPEMSIANKDMTMLDWVMRFLTNEGVYAWREPPKPDGVARVKWWRTVEIERLLTMMPLRHPERKAKARIFLDNRILWTEKERRLIALIEEIRRDRLEFIKLAEDEFARKGSTGNI